MINEALDPDSPYNTYIANTLLYQVAVTMSKEYSVEVEQNDSVFDEALATIGDDDRFQKRFNYVYNLFFVLLASMPYMNLVLTLSVPNHWCSVPGIEATNYSLEEWKVMHLPFENNTRGVLHFSKCAMFNKSGDGNNTNQVIDCKYGYDFDKTWYKMTAPSQQDWVCDKKLHVTNAFAFARMGEVVGTFIFGQISDIFGRRPVFFLTLITLVIGRSMTVISAGYVPLFFFACFLGSMPSMSIFLAPLVIGMEISNAEMRAQIAMMQCIGWTFGLCAMTAVMWLVGDWRIFMLLSTIPCAIFIFFPKGVIESPRWLLGRGKIDLCIRELKKIAKANKKQLTEETIKLIKMTPTHKENAYGIMGLFSSWRLAKNTLMLIISWIITILIYYMLTLNIENLGGNPFMNFFLQSLAELPAYIIGKYACDKFGRRWTNIGAFGGTAILCLPVIYIIKEGQSEITLQIISIFLKFAISFAFYAVNLQGLETYPTCIRQTGISLGGITGNAFGMLGPYIVLLGTSVNATYPYIISAALCLLAAICGIFLPETLNQKLPETLAEAQIFGATQDFWGRPKGAPVPTQEKNEKNLS